ncbi:hypothetical protein CAN33_0015795 [Aspergillus niger]|uniref:Uncharacterized protein n=1 Tax=Aspergillus niger TaxID=5061 RepID=A0A505IA87_ASPNG|nr:hypothetical protein CAN33_0015795 [Aspergillus niger]
MSAARQAGALDGGFYTQFYSIKVAIAAYGCSKSHSSFPASFLSAIESVTGDFVASVQTPVSGEQFNGDAQKASLAPTPVSTSAPPAPSGSGLVAVDSAVALNKHLEALQSAVSSEFSKSLGREVEGLYQRFDEERRSWDAASAAKQEQVLRLVSSTLSDNVEKNLARIVSRNIQTEVVPALSDLTVKIEPKGSSWRINS